MNPTNQSDPNFDGFDIEDLESALTEESPWWSRLASGRPRPP